jgi:hypothetical protein
MKITEYASLTAEELIQFALMREGATSLEIELAQKLMIAVDMIEGDRVEARSTEELTDGADTGR